MPYCSGRAKTTTTSSEARSLGKRERSIGASVVVRKALTAPVAGVIARTDFAIGQVIEPRDVLVEVVDPARMLVAATTADHTLGARVAGAFLQGVPAATLRLLGAARTLRDGVLPWKPGCACRTSR